MHPRYRTWRVRGIPVNYDKTRLAEILEDHETLQISQSHIQTLHILEDYPDLLEDFLKQRDIVQTLCDHPNLLKILREQSYLFQAIEDHPNFLDHTPHSDLQILRTHPRLLQFLQAHRELPEVVHNHATFLQTLQGNLHLLDIAKDKSEYGPGGRIANGVEIYTLASDDQDCQVATVRFACIPSALAGLKKEGQLRIVIPSDDADTHPGSKRARGPEVVIDNAFDGLTVLHSPRQNKHSIDVLAISGLGSHAFGSFTNKEDGYMWLCESLPRDLPCARVLVYGRDTSLHNSRSFAHLNDLARWLRPLITGLLQSDNKKPLVLIGHSLGGLVIKETLIKISTSAPDLINRICGLLFFGVPNNGLSHMETFKYMVKDQPNRLFLESLGPNSRTLDSQRQEFAKFCQVFEPVLFCFYETELSPTAIENKTTGKFTMSGPPACLVDNPSATSCLLRKNDSTALPIKRTHSELVKFARQDVDYRAVANCFKEVLAKLSKPNSFKIGNINTQAVHRPFKERETTEADETPDISMLSKEDKEKLCCSLQFDQIDTRKQTIKRAHVKTCAWILKERKYCDWRDPKKLPEHQGFLWIKGKPGAGKSTLMKFCVSKVPRRKTVLIQFYFHARGSDLEKSTEGMYRSILFQLLRSRPDLLTVFDSPEALNLQLERHQWTTESLETLFITAVQSLKGSGVSLVCFIDALDECPEEQIRDMVSFFGQVGVVAITADVNFSVCFSSRHYPNITITKGLSLVLEEQDGHQKDIEQYILSELIIKDTSPVEHPHDGSSSPQETLAENIRKELQEKANGIFMWIVLVVRMINEEFDGGQIDRLQQTVRKLPKNLHALFQDLLRRDEKNRPGLRLCVQWVLFARQPLIPRQLYCAIKSGLDERGPPGIDDTIEEKDVRKFILDSSKGLTEFTASDSPTVQFIHESVRDFFLKEGGSKEIWPELEEDFQGASHERLKQCCLAQMKHAWTDLQNDYGALPRVDRKAKRRTKGTANRRTSRAAELSQAKPPEAELLRTESPETIHLRRTAETKFPLLKYAVQNVLFHADLAQKYGVRQDNFLHEFQLPEWVKQDNLLAERSAHQHTLEASILYILAEQNLANLIAIHPSKLNWLEIGPERCGPPILAALASKSYKAVDALLEAQGNLYPVTSRLYGLWRNRSATSKLRSNTRFSLGSSVSSYIAELGEDTILEYIISKDDYNINQPDGSGQTLLTLAAKNGRKAVSRLLLEKGANIEAADSDGMTPLSWAARNGHEAALRLLLEKGANVEAADSDGKTPLLWAACNGHKAAIRLLLEKGANVEAADSDGKTPLSWAAYNGHEAVSRLLLEKGANVEAADSDGKTPLWWAACNGHEAVSRLLLEKGANVEAADSDGKTPLWWAACNGHEAVSRLLLEKGANVEAADSDGKTPLWWAACNGHEAVSRLLLEKGANVEVANSYGMTPLMWATKRGDTTIVELLALHASRS